MLEISDEAMEALKEKRVGVFVHIDLEFFPIRVHDGVGTVKWDGHKWRGLGDLLQARHTSRPLMPGKPMLEGDVSLPMDRKLGEALINGYYVDREIVISICALNKDDSVLERVDLRKMNIINFFSKDSVTVTFHAEDTSLNHTLDPTFDPEQEKEAIYKEGVRNRFKQNVLGVLLSSSKGDLANAIASFLPWTFLANILNSSLIRLGRLVVQRWRARNNWYIFDTDPILYYSYFNGWCRRRLRGRVRAYTERGAVQKIHARVRKNIWRFPREFRLVNLSLNGKMVHMINLEHYREKDNPQRCADTDPVKQWSRPTEEDNVSESPLNWPLG